MDKVAKPRFSKGFWRRFSDSFDSGAKKQFDDLSEAKDYASDSLSGVGDRFGEELSGKNKGTFGKMVGDFFRDDDKVNALQDFIQQATEMQAAAPIMTTAAAAQPWGGMKPSEAVEGSAVGRFSPLEVLRRNRLQKKAREERDAMFGSREKKGAKALEQSRTSAKSLSDRIDKLK